MFKKKTARIVSIFGHPFVLLPLTVAIAAFPSVSPARAFTFGMAVVLVTVIPLLIIIRRKVAAGKWSDHDVSEPSERGGFCPIAIGIVVISCFIFWFLDFPRELLLGVFISFALLLAAMFINQWSKISLHLSFAAFCAVSLMAVSYWISTVFILIAFAVGWSRIVLERHSLPQVLSGITLGAIAGIVLLKLINFF